MRDPADFLARAGWAGVAPAPLAVDASFRRYFRLVQGERRAVLMDAPPPQEDVRPFVALARHLRGFGYSAPEVLAQDEASGFLLLEDLGDDTYTRVLAAGGDEAALYAAAVDILIDLHRRPGAAALEGLPAYDDAFLTAEAMLFAEWYLPAVGRAAAPADLLAEALAAVLPLARAVPASLTLRDYHVDNLMHLPQRRGLAAVGLLDFQGAMAGPVAYDLASLVEDARRDIGDGLRAAMIARYRAAFPGLGGDLDAAIAFLGAQRHLKVIGLFTRLWRRDGKPAYLGHIPRVWRLLERSLAHPALAPLAAAVDALCPPGTRKVPSP
ncbi:MAG: phosphotransferase [Thalassobaculales bacterium]